MRNTPYPKMFPHAGTRSIARVESFQLHHSGRAPSLRDVDLRALDLLSPRGAYFNDRKFAVANGRVGADERVPLALVKTLDQKGMVKLISDAYGARGGVYELTDAGEHVVALMRGEYELAGEALGAGAA